MAKKTIYRIMFNHQDTIYDIYARSVGESEMFGFLEVEDFVFGENTSVVVDPSEEKLKLEFSNIEKTYIPLHSIHRIDRVTRQGVAKIRDSAKNDNKISVFPGGVKRNRDE